MNDRLRMDNTIKKALFVVTVFIIVSIPVLFGAVQPWVWSFYCLLMIFAFVLHMWTGRDRTIGYTVSPVMAAVALFFISTLFLCIPLPHQVLSVLSPKRADILAQTWLLSGHAPTRATLSYLPTVALNRWIFLLSLGLFFCVLRNLCLDRKILQQVVFILIGIGLIEAVYGLIQALVPSMGVLWVDYIHAYTGTARGTFINRNSFAGFIEMIWPLSLGVTLSMSGRTVSLKQALRSDRLNRQALVALGIIVFLLALIFSRSRAGIVSGTVGFMVFMIMARSAVKTVAKHTRIMLGCVVILLAVYLTTIGTGPIIHRFLAIGSASGSRMDIWRDSLPIIKDHPLGIGLLNYENVFAVYNQAMTSEKRVVHAHNDFLQLIIETGWVGSTALIIAIVAFLWMSVGRIKKLNYQRDPLRFFLAVGAFSGVISIAFHSLFDFNFQIPANCLYFVILIAILSACTRENSASSTPCHRIPN